MNYGEMSGGEQAPNVGGGFEEEQSLEQLQNLERRTENVVGPRLNGDFQELGQQVLQAEALGVQQREGLETQQEVLVQQAAEGIGTDLTKAVDQDGVDKVWEARMEQMVDEVKDPHKAQNTFVALANKFIADRYGWSWKDSVEDK